MLIILESDDQASTASLGGPFVANPLTDNSCCCCWDQETNEPANLYGVTAINRRKRILKYLLLQITHYLAKYIYVVDGICQTVNLMLKLDLMI